MCNLVIPQILVLIKVFYDLSLFISFKAFLPSLRVLKTSQDREEIIRIVSIIREIWVVSILLINLLKFLRDWNLKSKKF